MSTMDDETAIKYLKMSKHDWKPNHGKAIDKGIAAIETLALIHKAYQRAYEGGGLGPFYIAMHDWYFDEDLTRLKRLAGET